MCALLQNSAIFSVLTASQKCTASDDDVFAAFGRSMNEKGKTTRDTASSTPPKSFGNDDDIFRYPGAPSNQINLREDKGVKTLDDAINSAAKEKKIGPRTHG